MGEQRTVETKASIQLATGALREGAASAASLAAVVRSMAMGPRRLAQTIAGFSDGDGWVPGALNQARSVVRSLASVAPAELLSAIDTLIDEVGDAHTRLRAEVEKASVATRTPSVRLGAKRRLGLERHASALARGLDGLVALLDATVGLGDDAVDVFDVGALIETFSQDSSPLREGASIRPSVAMSAHVPAALLGVMFRLAGYELPLVRQDGIATIRVDRDDASLEIAAGPTPVQSEAFRKAARALLSELGCDVLSEKGTFRARLGGVVPPSSAGRSVPPPTPASNECT